MTQPAQPTSPPPGTREQATDGASAASLRLRSEDLFQQSREVEIMHGDRVYRLRLTQQNKLILTA
jgi:hemin uptake protein HemP